MRRLLRALFALVAAAFGCSSTELDTPAASGGARGGAGSGGAPEPMCSPAPGYREAVEPRQVDSVSALLVDLEGLPLENEVVQVCGTDLCIQGKSSATGGVFIAPQLPMRKPAFKFGEGKVSARFAWLLPDRAEIDLGTVRSVRLPELGAAVPILPGQPASSGGLTIEPASNAKIRFDQLTFAQGFERGLRAVRVPLEVAPAVVAEGPELEIVYATTPNSTEFCPPAKLSIENDAAWAPGTEVEVWLHGVDIEEEWAPYGGWAQVSEARVSEDGARIETVQGLRFFGVLGFKKK